MLSKEELDLYINAIPPIPAIIKMCAKAFDDGDLVKAATFASKDKALLNHFKNIVNKPIFGFSHEINDAYQIFGALGIIRARQVFHSYTISLISPQQWKVFALDNHSFSEIQASCIVYWEAILNGYNIKNRDYEVLVTTIPAAIAVCEAIFKNHLENINLIKEQKNISYEELLFKLSGYNFFDIVYEVAKKWGLSDEILKCIKRLPIVKRVSNEQDKILLSFLLLINYIVSSPTAIISGINDLFNINVEFSDDMIENFYNCISGIRF